MKNQMLMISFLISMIMISSLASVNNMKFTNSEGENMVNSVSYSLAKTENNADSDMFSKNFKSPTYVDHLVPFVNENGPVTSTEEIKSDANYYDGHKNLSFMQTEDETDGTDNRTATGDDDMKVDHQLEEDHTLDSAHRGAKGSTDDDDNALIDGESYSDPEAVKSDKKNREIAKKNADEAMKQASKTMVVDIGKDGSLADNDNYDDGEPIKFKSHRMAAPKDPAAKTAMKDTKGSVVEKTVGSALNSSAAWGSPSKPVKREDAKGRKGVKETFTYTPNTDEGDLRRAPKDKGTRKNKTTLNSRRVLNRGQPSLGDESNRQSGTTRIVEKVCNEYTDHVEACKNTGKCGWCANKNACMPQSSAGLKACQVGQFKLVKFAENFNPYGDDESITKKHEFSDGDLVFINPKPVVAVDPDVAQRK